MLQSGLHTLAEQQSVGQSGQSVMMRHEADARFRLPAFADVLVRRNPAPIVHRLMRHGQCASVGVLLDEPPGALGRRQRLLLQPDRLDDPVIVPSHVVDAAEQFGHRHPRPDNSRRQPEQLQKTHVADDHPLLGIGHAQCLRHIVQGGIEEPIARAQFNVAGAQAVASALQVRVRALEQPVVPGQQSDQGETADDQATQQRGEHPLQPHQLGQILCRDVAAEHIRDGGKPHHLRI